MRSTHRFVIGVIKGAGFVKALAEKNWKIRLGRKESISRKRTKDAAKSMAYWAAYLSPKMSRESKPLRILIRSGEWI
jgi:hypothetical protein